MAPIEGSPAIGKGFVISRPKLMQQQGKLFGGS